MVKRIDFKERRVIQDLLNHGTNFKDIASILQRSSTAIREEVKKGGGIRKYNAEDAQKLSNERAIEGNKEKNSPLQHLTKRVEQLENLLQTYILYKD